MGTGGPVASSRLGRRSDDSILADLVGDGSGRLVPFGRSTVMAVRGSVEMILKGASPNACR